MDSLNWCCFTCGGVFPGIGPELRPDSLACIPLIPSSTAAAQQCSTCVGESQITSMPVSQTLCEWQLLRQFWGLRPICTDA
jgi:hypothetical protein